MPGIVGHAAHDDEAGQEQCVDPGQRSDLLSLAGAAWPA
jgi:hypothetical protein